MVLWLYRLARFVFRVILGVVYRWDVRGREHLPDHGPVLVCANHIDWWDPPLVGSALPRPVFFMAKEELFRYPILGALLPKVGAFPVRRGAPDRRALKRALDLLADGRVVGIFPEGTRSKDGCLQEAEPGAALLAIRARVPVVLMAIMGPYRPLRPVRVRIGPPFELREYYDRRLTADALEEAGQRIMDRIRTLMDSPAGAAAD